MDREERKQRRPAVAVDVVLFTIVDGDLRVLLVRRKNAPFQGRWAIPGGFVNYEESLDAAALRELREETNVSDIYLEQLYTFGDPKRDPRTRVITIAYFALVRADPLHIRAADDARNACWFSMRRLPRLAFDHKRILAYALERLRNKLDYTPIAFQLLPQKFTLTELQRVYEIILGKKIDKRNFRKKLLHLDILKKGSGRRMAGVHRPAQLYSFVHKKFRALKTKGILFPF